MSTPERSQEIRLLRLLKRDYPLLYESYSENLAALWQYLCKDPISKNIEFRWMEGKNGHGFFRYRTHITSVFALSPSLSRFTAFRKYMIPIRNDSPYAADMAIVPIYLANFNRVSCIKLYGKDASGFNSYDKKVRNYSQLSWKLTKLPADNYSEYSSLNFILKNESGQVALSSKLSQVINKYMQYGFWSYPKSGYGCNPVIIFSNESINYILKAYKDIYIIRKVHGPRLEKLSPIYEAFVQKIEIQPIFSRSKTIWAYIPKDIIDLILYDQNLSSYRDIQDLIVNGLMYEIRDKIPRVDGSLKLFSAIFEILDPDIELPRTMAASIISNSFYNTDSTGYIGKLEYIKQEVNKHRSLAKTAPSQQLTIFDRLGAPLEQVMSDLYPVIINQEGNIYYVHPSVILALIDLGIEEDTIFKNNEIVLKFMSLIDKLRRECNPVRLRYSDETAFFRQHNIDFNRLLRFSLYVYKDMKLSKSLDCFF